MKTTLISHQSKELIFFFVLISLICVFGCTEMPRRDFYQIKIYTIENESQGQRMDHYLENALLPALHRAGISNVGVFKPVEEDESYGKFILVWIPFQSLDEFEKLPSVLNKDEQHQTDGQDYFEAAHDNAPYKRINNILLRAFEGMPEYSKPEHATPPTEQIVELRSYEGSTEKIHSRKVEMFNDAGEIDLFVKLGFQPVFFGEVISGSAMPNLMYMTTFSSRASQTEHWDAFRNSPEWNTMKEIEKYKNTVSHIDKYIMHPAKYSDL